MPCTITRVFSSIKMLIFSPSILRCDSGNNLLRSITHIVSPVETSVLEHGASLFCACAREAHDNRHALWQFRLRHNDALCHLFAACDAAEDIDQDALDLRVARYKGQCLVHHLGLRAAADIQEVGGLTADARHHIQCCHHESRAVTDDTYVTI